jgi:hypothetical protein
MGGHIGLVPCDKNVHMFPAYSLQLIPLVGFTE